MKIFAALVLALSAVNAAGVLFAPQPAVPFKSENDYTHCIDILQKVMDEATELSKLLLSHEYTKVVPLALELGKNIYEDINCFRHPAAGEVVQKFAVSLVQNVMQPNECQMTHIKNAVAAFHIALADLKLHLYKEAGAQLKVILAEVEAASQCPQ